MSDRKKEFLPAGMFVPSDPEMAARDAIYSSMGPDDLASFLMPRTLTAKLGELAKQKTAGLLGKLAETRGSLSLKKLPPQLDYEMVAEKGYPELKRLQAFLKGTKEGVGHSVFETAQHPELGTAIIRPIDTAIRPTQQGRGVATELYKELEKRLAGKVVPDELQTVGGRALHMKKGFGNEFGISPDVLPKDQQYRSIEDIVNVLKKFKGE